MERIIKRPASVSYITNGGYSITTTGILVNTVNSVSMYFLSDNPELNGTPPIGYQRDILGESGYSYSWQISRHYGNRYVNMHSQGIATMSIKVFERAPNGELVDGDIFSDHITLFDLI
jgi:hypothetical protein